MPNKYGAPEGRFHIRDEWDGSWAASDNLAELELLLPALQADSPNYELRIDDMEGD
jgi:hypothetical protein